MSPSIVASPVYLVEINKARMRGGGKSGVSRRELKAALRGRKAHG
jgi:hypothetical protein